MTLAQGIAAVEAGDYGAAERILLPATEQRDTAPAAWHALSVISSRLGFHDVAVERAQRAVVLEPRNPHHLTRLGVALTNAGETSKAERAFRRSLKLAPALPETHFNLAELLRRIDRFGDAIIEYERAIALSPSWQQAHFELAGLLLASGLWRAGWKHYLWRPDAHLRRPIPTPLPDRLDGRRVVLRGEQGLGDILFFLRFKPELEARGATVALELPAPVAKLAPILPHQVELAAPLANDLQIWIADLPAALQSEAIPPAFPLRVDETLRAPTRGLLAALGPPPYLGVTWRAGTQREAHSPFPLASKAVPPDLLGAAVRGWQGTILSLQRSPVPEDLATVSRAADAPVHDLGGRVEDPREALALLEQLHEYVTVSNTNVHLLAGLGRAAHVLMPRASPDWRWMLAGESPWFPEFSVYREGIDGWTRVLEQLRAR